ncbi:MAG: bifunctional UDP-N-acetylglucosamine diphosphorylase/glucosamine-1-phosphate N-acetyltransferase GlmU, partial [Rhodobacteraceae bacterium]|nr:bifunctional UDP-N-acetylglucosamine diphosphorylase/glucosamine-1-phosphate N-acetyltransferase GlmU [Paracoccaceae bacterium]
MSVAVALLVAGKGKRMRSHRPKVLHEIAGAPLYIHALHSTANLDVVTTVAVTGDDGDAVLKSCTDWGLTPRFARQPQQLGTGDALRYALNAMGDHTGPVLVLYGDTPLIRPDSLHRMITDLEHGSDLVVAGFHAGDPSGYGRMVTNADGRLQAIIESADTDATTCDIALCNSGLLCGERSNLSDLVNALDTENAAGEYYLTDIIGIAAERGQKSTVVIVPEEEAMGINTRAELARAEASMQNRLRSQALKAGTTLIDPATVYFSHDTVLAADVLIEPHVVFGRNVSVESGSTIRSFSRLESCHIGPGARIGPHAHIRPGTEVGPGAQVGNFVEVKASRLAAGVKANHLSYIGDADIGSKTNIGAGSVVCNYDGRTKHRTRIGEKAFIGSGSMLVAPLKIGDEALTAAGSVITEDVPSGARAF